MNVKAVKPVWCIAITFGDEENNGFVTLGWGFHDHPDTQSTDIRTLIPR
ncbi:hypothetical protein [Pseudomonas syringae]|nr:hypothetical protein [Pseudomonas syringae]